MGSTERKELRSLILVSVVVKLMLALFATDFVLVDDAYITLRYARNLVEHGELVYNQGEAVFGITTPLWSLCSSVLYLLCGSFVEVSLILVNLALWSWAGWIGCALVPERLRHGFLTVFLFAPSFVDNQMLGMETSLFVLLMLGAMEAALRGNARCSAAFCGLLLITRPEAVLLSPCLLTALASDGRGFREAFRRLLKPAPLALLLAPGCLWVAFAVSTYGSVLPQSMLAKTGWNAEHYDDAGLLAATWRALPRLTFVPFIDFFPGVAGALVTGCLLLAVAWIVAANVRHGDAASRAWLGFYLLYLAFYVLGKGATEASWYSVPSSVALLLASRPAWPVFLIPTTAHARLLAVLALAGASSLAAFKRGALLRYYEEGYGESARFLNERSPAHGTPDKVVIGEIGVYGFHSVHSIVDVAALVSPEVLDMKERSASFVGIVRESNARWFVISDRALEENRYPSVGPVWRDETERRWLEQHCRKVGEVLDKNTYHVVD